MDLAQIKSLETQQGRAVTGGEGRCNLFCFAVVPQSLDLFCLKWFSRYFKKCFKLSCKMLQEIKVYGFVLVGHCIFNTFRDS